MRFKAEFSPDKKCIVNWPTVHGFAIETHEFYSKINTESAKMGVSENDRLRMLIVGLLNTLDNYHSEAMLLALENKKMRAKLGIPPRLPGDPQISSIVV